MSEKHAKLRFGRPHLAHIKSLEEDNKDENRIRGEHSIEDAVVDLINGLKEGKCPIRFEDTATLNIKMMQKANLPSNAQWPEEISRRNGKTASDVVGCTACRFRYPVHCRASGISSMVSSRRPGKQGLFLGSARSDFAPL